MKLSIGNTSIPILLLLLIPGSAHYPFSEPERSRFTNWESNGLSYSAWTRKEDWSFENPFDIVKSTISFQTGKIRPNASILTDVLLATDSDYDVLLFNKSFPGVVPLLGLLLVPNCLEYSNFYPSLTLLGPLGTRDIRTNKTVFKDARGANLPFSVPIGYGHITRHQYPQDGPRVPEARPELAQQWIAPHGYREFCVQNWNKCNWDLISGTILTVINNQAEFWWIIWRRSGMDEAPKIDREGECSSSGLRRTNNNRKWDVSFVTGITDEFEIPDFVRGDTFISLNDNGRSTHRTCTPKFDVPISKTRSIFDFFPQLISQFTGSDDS